MATALDRIDLGGPAPPRSQRQPVGLVLTVACLILALLAVVWVQTRQFATLREAVRSVPEYSVMAVYQAEFEYQRLLDQWQQAANTKGDLDERGLRLRYDIWVSRINLLNTSSAARLANFRSEDRTTLDQARAFIQRADQVLGISPDPAVSYARLPVTPQFLVTELPNLRELGGPIHNLTLSAAETVALEAEQRTARVHELNAAGLALTVSLCLLTLAFGTLALHQLRMARERRLALEQLTERLRLAQQTAERANAAKSEFLANMSHEVRTPFHGMVGMLSLLRETGLTSKQSAYLRTATESADHLLAVLNDILDLSQLETGALRFSTTPTELRTLLRDVEALVRPLALAKGLDLHVDIAPDVPEIAQVDPVRVRQVLFNLLSNAIKFTDRGAVAMDMRVRRAKLPTDQDQREGVNLEVSVSDTGVGIDPIELAHLFDRFQRVQTQPAAPAQGAGLGLEIARKLARAMQGDIVVRSQRGQGSCFTLSLPLVSAQAASNKLATQHERPGIAQRSLKILVAEDHPVNRQYMDELLMRMGHVVTFAVDGEQAVAMARDNDFDVLLMDLHMPTMDGIAAARIIRALPNSNRATVPMVALTADAFNETRDRCLVAGMNGFLTKPVMPDHLNSTLRRLFGATELSPVKDRPKTGPSAEAQTEERAGEKPLPAWMRDVQPEATNGEETDRQAAALATAQSATTHDALIDLRAVRMLLQTLSVRRYSELAIAYFEQAPLTVERLRCAVRDGQPLDVRANAHAARGAALNLGLTALSATAQALQQGAAHLPAHEIARLIQRFDEQITSTRESLMAHELMPGAALQTTSTQ
jgi:two-component system, sensor histidine kinase